MNNGGNIVIPEYIMVHLGAPSNANAKNVRVPFAEYIKNVASNEIYPDWPEAAIRANVLAQISFALNRVYLEWYPSMGYNFDITNDTTLDQSYQNDGAYFENISILVDEIFNNYIVRQGQAQPLFAQYCDGRRTVCLGLSQWGSVELAEQGFSADEILRYYYGDAIQIIENAPVQGIEPSYPDAPLYLGVAGEAVRTIQQQLNAIAWRYPAMPVISKTNGVYGIETTEAVAAFQNIFDLPETGIVDKATWYRIKSIFNGVRRLAELDAEGLTFEEIKAVYPLGAQLGGTGIYIRILQYYLAVIGYFDDAIPQIQINGVYDAKTEAAVLALQRQMGLPETGQTDRRTWNAILQAYIRIVQLENFDYNNEIFPGRVLSMGMEGEDVRLLQMFLNRAAERNAAIPAVPQTGVYDEATDAAVRIVQERYGLLTDLENRVGPVTWDRIVSLSKGETTL